MFSRAIAWFAASCSAKTTSDNDPRQAPSPDRLPMFPFAQLPEPLPELRQAPSLQGQQLRIDGLELRSSWQWEGLNRSQPDQLWLPLELLESHLGFRRHEGQLEWFGHRQPLAELPLSDKARGFGRARRHHHLNHHHHHSHRGAPCNRDRARPAAAPSDWSDPTAAPGNPHRRHLSLRPRPQAQHCRCRARRWVG